MYHISLSSGSRKLCRFDVPMGTMEVKDLIRFELVPLPKYDDDNKVVTSD